MELETFLKLIDGDLSIEEKNGCINIIDEYYENDPTCDFGIWESFPNEEKLVEELSNQNLFYYVPDYSLENFFEYRLSDMLVESDLNNEEIQLAIQHLKNTDCCWMDTMLDGVIEEDDIIWLHEMCQAVRGEKPLTYQGHLIPMPKRVQPKQEKINDILMKGKKAKEKD